MAPRFIGIAVLATVLTVAVPLFVAKRLHLGSYATSPQTVTISLGSTCLIAGGRAELWYGGERFEVSCVREKPRRASGEPDVPCTECGVMVRQVSVDSTGPVPRATFVVTWREPKP